MAGSDYNYNYQLLANAIVEQAADDYFCLVAGFTKTKNEADRKDKINALQKFFLSDWYSLLTKVDEEYLMRKLNEKAETMVIVYTVAHEKGSSLWYVCKPGEENVPLSPRWKTKKRALRKAAEMQGLDLIDYIRVRKRDGID